MAKKKMSAQTKSKAANRQQTLFELFLKKNGSTSDSEPVNPSALPQDADKKDILSRLEESGDDDLTSAVVDQLRRTSLEPQCRTPFVTRVLTSPKRSPLSGDDASETTIIDFNKVKLLNVKKSFPHFVNGKNREDPISVDTSPQKPTPIAARTKAPLAPIFSLRGNISTVRKKNNSEGLHVPYPGSDSQHVRGPQRTFPSPIPFYPLRKELVPSPAARSNEANQDRLSFRMRSILSEKPPIQSTSKNFRILHCQSREEQSISNGPVHPAITRFQNVSPRPTLTTHSMWVDKWRPTCAEEVLGNETNALYLRDWLRALELHDWSSPLSKSFLETRSSKNSKFKGDIQPKKRSRVIRAVESVGSRKKRRLEGFTVSSDESEEPYLEDSGDELMKGDSFQLQCNDSDEYIPIHKKPTARYPEFDKTLKNTIVISGPPGVGKTAAVYACAKELGWEVFEVFPGIGKRNNVGLESYIGDVGKQHHVNSGIIPPRGHTPPVRLARNNDKTVMMDPFLDDRDAAPICASKELSVSGIKQSLVLLDEVDILFKDDANFWPSVIQFIQNCKRPVIFTCNDLSLLPKTELPVQTVLYFQPCAPSLAASYLQALCYAEGHEMDQKIFSHLSGFAANTTDDTHIPDINELDLRRAINFLQFLCSTTVPHMHQHPPPTSSFDMSYMTQRSSMDASRGQVSTDSFKQSCSISTSKDMVTYFELASFIDSLLVISPWDKMTTVMFNSYEPSADDEIGHPIFFAKKARYTYDDYDRDEEFISAVLPFSRGCLETEMTTDEAGHLFRARVDRQQQTFKALRGFVPLTVLTLHYKDVSVDYLPRVQEIVALEDAQLQAALRTQKTSGGRRTRNSQRDAFERVLRLNDEQKSALERTRLKSFGE